MFQMNLRSTTLKTAEYMKTAIDMEADIIAQEQIVEQCCEIYENRKPFLKLENLPTAPQPPADSRGLGIFIIIAGISFALVIGAIIGFKLWWIPLLIAGALVIPSLLMIKESQTALDAYNREYNVYSKTARSIRDKNDEKEKS